MKTPRELLFEHHRNAQPDLDQLRRDVLKTMASGTAQPQSGFWSLSWLLPSSRSSRWRFQVAGLSAAWVVILAFNLFTDHDSSIAPANAWVGSDPTASVTWREYRRQLSEALESQPAVAATRPDQRSLLKPCLKNALLSNAFLSIGINPESSNVHTLACFPRPCSLKVGCQTTSGEQLPGAVNPETMSNV